MPQILNDENPPKKWSFDYLSITDSIFNQGGGTNN